MLLSAMPVLLALAMPTAPPTTTPAELWRRWPEERFVELDAPCLRHHHVVAAIDRLLATHPGAVEAGRLAAERIGASVEGRSIHLVTLGNGPFEVLLWSQMHGDEPSATPALFDLAHHLLSRAAQPEAAHVLERLTLRMIPMLNPDGAERYQRRNAQGIDVNRDALRLATPEGRLLKEIRDRYRPELGINLHDQSRRNVVGDTGVLATNAVMAVAGDEEGTVTPGRRRAMRACSAIVSSLTPFTAGGVARYDEDWSPRAFGDNLTAWGTPVVLLESGAPPDGGDLAQLTRLNFVALAVLLRDLAADDLAGHDPKLYEELPRNRSDAWADRLVRGARPLLPGLEPFPADVAWNLHRPERAHACVAPADSRSSIVEVGDARFFGATEVIESERGLLLPGFVVGADGWKARRWLTGESLDRLAAWGVDRVRWRVPPSRLHAAENVVRALDGDLRASVELTVERERLPAVVLQGAPAGPPPERLGEVVAGLLVEASARDRRGGDGGPVRAGLERLWRAPPSGATIRNGGRASFLLVEPPDGAAGDGGSVDLRAARIQRIWIDGVEVHGSPDGAARPTAAGEGQ
ncbi:MAG TPA: M14 family zinc carboxypeptidase [Thermoanaerobaculia bacterium]|nr:M14 family zinc carboxypeptidase [Thermoanaerobaculia bacterium]